MSSLEAWAFEYVVSTSLEEKLALEPPPRAFDPAWDRVPSKPGRPPELVIRDRRFKTPGRDALRDPTRRAELLHTFFHHELQAAELMCWAILAFRDTPDAFKRGLAAISIDERRHMRMYGEHIAKLGHRVGDFPVRDWFWERVPHACTAAQFVATLGVGFEGANLDHTERFAERFDEVGDVEGAALQRIVGEEEIPHVRFALKWLRELGGGDDFATWSSTLPKPLSPMVMRGDPIRRAPRMRAGLSSAFVDELIAWCPTPGS